MAATEEFFRAFGIDEIASTYLGWDAKTGHVPAIPAAIAVYASVFVIGYTLMGIAKLLPKSVRGFAMDFFLTMTLCTYPFGHGILRKNYGEPGYILACVPLLTITFALYPSAHGNPIGVWLNYFQKGMSLKRCLLKSFLQLFAGLAGYRLGMFILNLQLHPDFVDRLTDYYNSFCITDLTVPLYVGFLIEFCGVVYESWFCSLNLIKHRRIDELIKTIHATLMVSAGVHFTGMYMHPAMATAHTFGCGDTPRAAHILIYWVGPIIGAWLSVQIQAWFRSSTSAQKKTAPAATKRKVKYTTKVEKADMNGNINEANGNNSRKRKRFFNN